MFWIYVPPIIFVSALIILVVIFGKKTALLKKKGEFSSVSAVHIPENSKKSGKWKNIWIFMLRLLENSMYLAKIGIRKMEASLTQVLRRMKEKRLGKKTAEPLSEKSDGPLYFESEDFSLDMDITPDKSKKDKQPETREAVFFREEVVVKKKEDPAPQRIMPELAAENKPKEEALIHRIAENPKDIEAYRELGDYYMSIGNIKDSKDSFKMVLKLRPRDLKAKSSLREIEMKMRLGS